MNIRETMTFHFIQLNTIKHPRNEAQILVTNSAPKNILALMLLVRYFTSESRLLSEYTSWAETALTPGEFVP